jgi:hypothetical protein
LVINVFQTVDGGCLPRFRHKSEAKKVCNFLNKVFQKLPQGHVIL